ncbi:MAG TPA: RecQ family zinc-binding domain-containing protein, partial [Chondromyces sp.]|nr:RecQ family zinc-binding domain-containing protein [Chondromyces sp.]
GLLAGKQKKLEEMTRWIFTETCRRKSLLSYFNETSQSRQERCCDHCGLTYLPYQKKKVKDDEEQSLTWEFILQKLLNQ